MTNANSADNQSLKIGELAKRTGVSIRTLHYYDEIGLLSPVTVTKSRHRLYGSAELVRLQQIKSLRQLGFSLEEVRACLDAPEFSPTRVIDMHVRRLRDQIDKERRLIALLETLGAGYQAETLRSVQDFIGLIEEITTIERSFTPDELNEIHRRGEQMGAEHIKAIEKEWPTLIAQVRREMLVGTDPKSAQMQPLASRWRRLVREFTGGNPSIERKVRASFVAEPKMMERTGLDPAILAYANAAIRALNRADE
jgi:MerR family transcriptional regulator, thiopeptide resistance regulator